MSAPEFSRPVRLDALGPAPRAFSIEADEGERAALARRFGLQAIESLAAQAQISLAGDVVRADGRLAAAVTQSCVASGAPVEARLDEEFRIEFRPPPPAGGSADEEIELGEGDLDVVFYSGSIVDLGEAVSETLSLALDPYPRASQADAVLTEVGVEREGNEKRPGALAGLKDLLGKGSA